MATPLGGYVPPILQQSPAGKAARVASITRGDAHLAVVNAKIAALRNEAGLGPSAEELEDERRKTDAEEKQNYWLTVGHAVFASVSMVSAPCELGDHPPRLHHSPCCGALRCTAEEAAEPKGELAG